MSTTIDNVFIQTYERTVRHLAQQVMTRLRAHVDERSVQSEAHNWERIASSSASQKTTRKTATPDGNTAWSRRKSIPKAYHCGDVTEHTDIAQMLVDPNSNYAMAHARAMNRAFDDEIIAAATGASRDGDGNSVSYVAGQTVGDGSAAITFDNVTEVSEKFLAKDIDPDEPKVFVISPVQQRKLLQLTEATSRDYGPVDRGALMKGYVDNWMGYTWIVSTRLLAPDTGEVDCFAMTKRAIGLQVNKDIWTRVAEDPSISFAWRIYCEAHFGAIRVEDEQLVRVHLLDSL